MAYGGSELGLEWNVLLFASSCGYTIKETTLYRYSFQEVLSLIDRYF